MGKLEKIVAGSDLVERSVEQFSTAPTCKQDQVGFLDILQRVQNDSPFVYCKLNHAFWERLATIEKAGIPRAKITKQSGAALDAINGRPNARHFEGGMFFDLLKWIGSKPDFDKGLLFVPSIEPYPGAREIAGAPLMDTQCCLELMEHFVDPGHLREVRERGYSGHEVKVSVLTGGLRDLLDELKGRDVITVMNKDADPFIASIESRSLYQIQIDAKDARHTRNEIAKILFEKVNSFSESPRPPVVLLSAGDTVSSWLGLQIQEIAPYVQFIDFGGAVIPFHNPPRPVQWMTAYGDDLRLGMTKILGPDNHYSAQMASQYGTRNSQIVAISNQRGVPEPTSIEPISAPLPKGKIPFLENKVQDQSRIADFLTLSISQNHHADGGPVVALLEEVVARILHLPAGREVVAACSGTAALHLAATIKANARSDMRWVTSAFNGPSAGLGPLAHARILDCDPNGRFDLDALKAMPLEAFDGVVYTNVFAKHGEWDDIARYCQEHGKDLIVDNATGLFDRPKSALAPDAPMEAISAHHTKPWGVGEGGFLICSRAEAELARRLAALTAPQDQNMATGSTNAKMSDLAAAAILDRIERIDHWSPFYNLQATRAASTIIDADCGVASFGKTSRRISPAAHSVFLAPHPVDIHSANAQGPATLAKYYKPLRSQCANNGPTPIADDLYARAFSLSNAPEMRLIPSDKIVHQIRGLVSR